ncbi:hypothetical protein J6590_033881 [Homalodisca vitripennis]|nr:hypothetical protein J6590_033881 [Homalodisca vitripennis]
MYISPYEVRGNTQPGSWKVGFLQGHDRLAVTHPGSRHGRRCLTRLSCDNRCTRWATPLLFKQQRDYKQLADQIAKTVYKLAARD